MNDPYHKKQITYIYLQSLLDDVPETQFAKVMVELGIQLGRN